MPHLSPIIWFLVVFLFLAVLRVFISCFWWSQVPRFKTGVAALKVEENKWAW